MLRCLVISGFEPSGHDSVATSLIDATPTKVESSLFMWRDVRPKLSRHPFFHVHRELVGQQQILHPSVLGSPAIHDALADDLQSVLPLDGVGLILSTHPYSTAIARREVRRRFLHEVRIVDVHTDYSRFPVVDESDADLFCGRFPRRIRDLRARLHVTGIPVTVPPSEEGTGSGLLLHAGSGGWALEHALPHLRTVAEWCGEGPIGVCAEKSLAGRIELMTGRRVRIERPGQPYGSLFSRYRYVLTKASGPPVSYAHATGAIPILYRTGVAWEDEAAVELVAANLAAPAWFPPSLMEKVGPQDFCPDLPRERTLARRAASAVWAAALDDAAVTPSGDVSDPPASLLELLGQAAEDRGLPRAASVVAAALRPGRAMRTPDA